MPQSIVVAAVATQQHGQEGAILRFRVLHSLVLALLIGPSGDGAGVLVEAG